MYELADAIFAYIEELSAESVEGYASELSVKRNDRVINKAVKEVLKDG